MSRYAQFCGVARSLDVVGDRWTLLIVRELLVAPRRFGELRQGLPGIATNLLSQRLAALQEHGVLERRLDGRDVRYGLTPRGEELRGVLRELVRWSVPIMASGPAPDDRFRPEWLAVAIEALTDARPRRMTVVLLRCTAEDGTTAAVTLRADPDGAVVRLGDPEVAPDLTLEGSGPVLLGLWSGVLTVAEAQDLGLRAEGALGLLDDLASRRG